MSILSEYRKNSSVLISDTALLCDDPNAERFSRARYLEALNEFILDFVLDTETVIDRVNIQILAEQEVYNISERIVTQGTKELAWIKHVEFIDDTDENDFTSNPFAYPHIQPTNQRRLDFLGGQVLTAEGDPQEYMNELLNYDEIQLWPLPNTAGEDLPTLDGNFRIQYVALPDIMTADSENVYPDSKIPTWAHRFLPFGAAERLLEEGDSQDFNMSLIHGKEALGGTRKTKKELGQRTGYQVMRPM